MKRKLPRKSTPVGVEQAVLANSGRRCTLCFGLKGDLSEKLGQIAHLEGNPANNAESNLAWMCLEHHSIFDSKNSQHKNYTVAETKAYRNGLYDLVASGQHIGTDTRSRGSADRETLETLLNLCSGPIQFIRRRNFAGFSFDPKHLEGLERFLLLTGAEYEFVDAELESLRTSFCDVSQNMMRLLMTNTFPVGNTGRQSIPQDWEIDQPKRFFEAVSEVHSGSDSVCTSYDQLVRVARRKLL